MTRRGPARISIAVRRAIVAHARRDAPRECCGLLLGRGRQVMVALPMQNVDPRPTTRFRIDDRAHIVVRRVLRRVSPQVEVVGVYHSHPRGPAYPSPADLAEALYPEWLHVIVGLARPAARLLTFEINRGAAKAVPMIQRRRRVSR